MDFEMDFLTDQKDFRAAAHLSANQGGLPARIHFLQQRLEFESILNEIWEEWDMPYSRDGDGTFVSDITWALGKAWSFLVRLYYGFQICWLIPWLGFFITVTSAAL